MMKYHQKHVDPFHDQLVGSENPHFFAIEISVNFYVLQKTKLSKTWIQYLSLPLVLDKTLSKHQLTGLSNRDHLKVPY